jgi:predicted nucleic acid-binding protein
MRLKNQRQKIGLGDSLIAATALGKGLNLVTRKIAPFTNIPGLTVVDWHIP